jgi:hypothetical protein
MRKIKLALAGALLATLAVTGSVSAATAEGGPECLQSGLAVLQANGGVQAFARNGVPVALIDPSSDDVLSLSTVLRLHLTNPGMWPWC